MRRLALIGSWKRLGLQVGLLGGLGLAFMGSQEKPVQAGADCADEGQCTFKKPNFMFVVDYSSSMNEDFVAGQTNWEAAVEAINNVITTDGGFFDENMHLALLRFGHDPVAALPGTTIVGDPSGITDGVSLDVHWYDPVGDPGGYYNCNGAQITAFLNAVAPPLCNAGGPPPSGCAGIGTWTNGALQEAQDVIAQTRLDHPSDLDPGDERFYAVMLVTDGNWTGQEGSGQPADQNPSTTAGDLFGTDGVPVYVVAFGNALGNAFADQIAMAGGTTASIQAGAGQLEAALEEVVDDIAGSVIIPQCTAGLPRIMVILDASSSMLNVGGVAGPMGMTGWDQARDALAGMNSLFDVPIAGVMNQPVEDLVHLGLTVFGHNSPAEEQVLIDYGPCMEDNFAWALDPNTSCAAGCADPWGGPPITWTFVGPGDAAYPGFDQDTYSHMPDCVTGGGNPAQCTGSGTYVHLGLDLADDNYHAYSASPPPLYAADENTVYVNILITDGAYNSTDAQVEGELSHMYSADGITTYVIGFGDATSAVQLDNMACWGSGGTGFPCNGGTLDAFDATSQDDLEMALQTIIEGINFDPCCAFNDCSFNPEPTTGEVDPVMPPESTGEPPSSSSDGGESSSDGADTVAPPMTTTGGEDTSGGVVDTGNQDSTGGPSVDDTASGDSASASGSDTGAGPGGDTPSTMSTTATPGDDSGDGTETEGPGGDVDDGGCSCSTDDSTPRGWLGGLLMLGVFGLRRRRP
jgi:MYXO-CTERM domain-containing protein